MFENLLEKVLHAVLSGVTFYLPVSITIVFIITIIFICRKIKLPTKEVIKKKAWGFLTFCQYFFIRLLFVGGFLAILILPFIKNGKKEIVRINPQTVGIVCLAIVVLILITIGIVYGLHKRVKVPKISDWTKKWFKRLCLIILILGIWWYWYPIKKWVLPVINERPGVEKKAVNLDSKKENIEVTEKVEKEEKVIYYLRWEKPKDRRLRYINFPDGRCDILSLEENNGCISFIISNPSKRKENIFCSLQPFNTRKSCGKWNGKDVYNTSEPVWEWKGVYTNHLGQVGNIYMNKESSSDKTKYTGKVFLPDYPDKWINLVIYQERR